MALASNPLQPAVVLVADRTLSADYKVLFEGMFATMQTTQVPEFAMRRLMSPPIAVDRHGRAAAAILGLRRVESSLLANTSLGPDDVVCTTPEALPRLLGPWTKIVAVSSSDPLGQGMSNTTTANFQKGQLYTRVWTARMMAMIREAKRRHGFKVIAGGAGAWQWVRDKRASDEQGIDTIFEGYFESQGPAMFTDVIDGKSVPFHVSERKTTVDDICTLRGPSVLGGIELSRGCGKGCRFCVMSDKKMLHLPTSMILSDLQVNVDAGVRSVFSGSEDFFRYGGSGSAVNFERLHGLLTQMQAIPQLGLMQIDHANISSVLQFTDDQLKEIRRALTWREKSDHLWVNMGIESANGHLVHANCPGKIAPFQPDNWEQMVRQTAQRMTQNGFSCVFSIILGLPGETPDDVQRTLNLVNDVSAHRAVIFPIFYEPPGRGDQFGPRFDLTRMRQDHLDLFSTCYEFNFKRVPKIVWDNQRAGGVSWAKRMLIQILGKTEIISWRRTFARVRRQIASRPSPVADDVSTVKRDVASSPVSEEA